MKQAIEKDIRNNVKVTITRCRKKKNAYISVKNDRCVTFAAYNCYKRLPPEIVSYAFSNQKDMRSKFHGQTYMFFPVHVENNQHLTLSDDENRIDGYLIVSKRVVRTDNRALIKSDINKLNVEAKKIVEDYTTRVNNIIDGNLFDCHISFDKHEYVYEMLTASTQEELVEAIHGKMSFFNNDVDALVDFEAERIFTRSTQMSIA